MNNQQIRLKKGENNGLYDFSNISKVSKTIIKDRSFMVEFNKQANQLIKDNQAKLINKINDFIKSQVQTQVRSDTAQKQTLFTKQYKESTQVNSNVDNQIQFTRKEVFILLLMMYSNQIENDNQIMKQTGFYQINMEQIKQSNSQQSYEKLKCIHSYFLNFFQKFIQKDESSIIQMQIQDIENQIRKQEQIMLLLQTQRDNLKQKLNNSMPKQYNEEDELITFIRRTEYRIYDEVFKNYKDPICQFDIKKGRCEDIKNSILVNFADKNVGGLSLDTRNIAQEEVLMLTHPEALIAMLFMQQMKDNEAILIRNVIKYNDYDGYESTFKQKEEAYFKINEPSLKQNQAVIKNHILFMDALYYQNWQTQFDQSFIQRELLKGYVAFSLALEHLEIENISTGKWGCGIFHGDLTLKFLIQLLAFSQAYQDMINKNQLGQNQFQRSIIFNSFHDEQFEYLVSEQKAQFSKQNSSIKYIHQLIEDLSKRVNSKKNNYAKN
ncbi:unnamed protein product (macronuclear) [Paramecium tetraurelia]|uniref:PARG catalytic Macro domain-containing protein n=1 Tax=Paramecium tetraurelia TaxID=5888 RepID=A0DV95_PARTE|nr:uncharacterized protein GSPATT00020626001 [Paramecium tetraurelia]CAK86962.1 unnamed protein product [Paramecium tetraurelia]|eukprot:XP_001454359.1 hypothetical protein (macronuclear) [Paramecium tetraurelia strain d4-2]